MMRIIRGAHLGCIVMGSAVCAPSIASRGDEAPRDFAEFTAPHAVREGNRLLEKGAPQDALKAYDHAETLRPDAREIAFGKGLAHYALKQFDEARGAFEQAQSGMNDRLADDALYSLGTCDHAEAIGSADRPEQAIAHLESAMQKYQSTLQHRPDHAAARDAIRKAAVMRRQLKQLLQQQQEQQKNQGDQQDQKQDQNQNQKQESPQRKEQDQQEQKDQNTDEQEKDQQDKQQSSQEKNQEQEKPQESPQPSADQQQEKQEQEAQAQQQERATREHAQRKLREMVQAMRDRKKNRAEEVRRVPVAPAEKDW